MRGNQMQDKVSYAKQVLDKVSAIEQALKFRNDVQHCDIYSDCDFAVQVTLSVMDDRCRVEYKDCFIYFDDECWESCVVKVCDTHLVDQSFDYDYGSIHGRHLQFALEPDFSTEQQVGEFLTFDGLIQFLNKYYA